MFLSRAIISQIKHHHLDKSEVKYLFEEMIFSTIDGKSFYESRIVN